MRVASGIFILAVLIGAAIWWAGLFGLFMGVAVALAGGAILLNNTGILTLPPKVKMLLWAILVGALAGGVASGIMTRHEQKAKLAAHLAAQSPPPPAAQNHWVDVRVGEPTNLMAGHNSLVMMPNYDTDCLMAGEGWYFIPDFDRRWLLPEGSNVETWANCHLDGGGARVYKEAGVRARSIRIVNRMPTPERVGIYKDHNRVPTQERR